MRSAPRSSGAKSGFPNEPHANRERGSDGPTTDPSSMSGYRTVRGSMEHDCVSESVATVISNACAPPPAQPFPFTPIRQESSTTDIPP